MTEIIERIDVSLERCDFTLGDVALLQRRAKERGTSALLMFQSHTGCSEDEGSAWLAEVKERKLILAPRKSTDRFYRDTDRLGGK